MSVEQKALAYGYDSDIVGDQIGKAVHTLIPGSVRLDKVSTAYYGILTTLWGGIQISAEANKIIAGTAGDKFPLGWTSFNPVEEFLEGSIPAVVGAYAGKKAYSLMCSVLFKNGGYNKVGEGAFMFVGSICGYGIMVNLGRFLEQRYGIPDIKWGPFK